MNNVLFSQPVAPSAIRRRFTSLRFAPVALPRPNFRLGPWLRGTIAPVFILLFVLLAAAPSANAQEYILTYGAGTGGRISTTFLQGLYPGGTQMNFTAIADPGYSFIIWQTTGSLVLSPTNPQIGFQLTANTTLAANFGPTPVPTPAPASHWKGQTNSNWSGQNWAGSYNGTIAATTNTPNRNSNITFSASGAQNQTPITLDVDATIASLTVNTTAGLSGNKTLTINNLTNIDNGGNLTVNSGVTVKSGQVDIGSNANGTVTVTGANAKWESSSNLYIDRGGTGTLNVLNGASFSNSAAFLAVASSDSATVVVDGTGSNWTNFSNVIVGVSGPAALTISNGGQVDVNGVLFGSGRLTLGDGIGASGTLNIGTFGGNSTAGTLNAAEVRGGNGTATVNFNQTNDITFAPIITGSAAVNQLGTGTTSLTGTSTYAGQTVVSAGTLYVNGDNSAATGNVTVSGGTLSGNGKIGGNITVQSGGTITAGKTEATTSGQNYLLLKNLSLLDGSTALFQIGGSTNFDQMGGDTLSATGNVTLSLQLTGGYTGVAGDRFLIADFSNYSFALSNFNLTSNLGSQFKWDLTGLTSDGTVAIALSVPPSNDPATHWLGWSNSTWSGQNWASNAAGDPTTSIPNSNSTITLSATGAQNQTPITLDVDATITDLTVSATAGLSGNKTLTVTGNTNIENGNLTLSNGVILQSVSGIIADQSGTTGSVTIDGGQWTSSDTLAVGNSGNGSLTLNSGTVSNAFIVAIAYLPGSTGAATVNGGNWTNTGEISVAIFGNGSLTLNNGTVSNALGFIGAQNGSTGTVTVNGGNWTNSDILSVGYHGNGTLRLNGGTVSTTQSVIGAETRSNGTLSLLGGVLSTGQVSEFGGNGTVTFSGGTLRLSGGQANLFAGFESGDVMLTGVGGTIDTQGFEVATALGLTGDGSLTKQGNGTLTLIGNNTYTGGTTVSEGTLQIGAGGTDGSIVGNVALSSGRSSMAFNRGDTYTFGGNITGSGSVLQSGNGATVLTANSTYSGRTTVAAGTLYVNGDNSASTGNVTVSSGTLGGIGIIGGNVTVQSGATIAAGADAASGGHLTTNNLTLLDGSIALFKLANPNNLVPVILQGGLLASSGNVTLSLQLTGGYTGNVGDGFKLFAYDQMDFGATNFLLATNLSNGLAWDTSFLASRGVVSIMTAPAPAVTHWLGQTDSNWSAANWASNAAGNATTATPTSNDDITFSATGATNQTGTVLDADTTIKSLTVNSTAGIQGNKTLTITRDTNVNAGTLTLSGNVTVLTGGRSVIDGPGAGATVTVDGAGATWSTTGDLIVGDNATGALNVNGGSVSSNILYVGNMGGSSGTLTLAGGTINAGFLAVGEAGGTGALFISGGVLTNPDAYISDYAGGGSATVSGGTWNNTGNLYVGGGGLGTLDITGGLVTTGVSARLGLGGNTEGRVTVSGNGTFQNAGDLIVGDAGTGTLNIVNGGSVSVGNGTGTLTLGAQSGSTGTLNIGTFGGNSTAGTVNAAEVKGGTGTATINFNQTDVIVFTPNITGSTSVNALGGGATSLSGNLSYSGLTTITGTRLNFTGSMSALTGNITNGGTLGLLQAADTTYSGTITGTGNNSIDKSGNGTVTLGGSVASINNTFINAGTLNFTGDMSGLTGNILIYGDALGLGQSVDTTYNGSIGGTGNVVKFGTATTTIANLAPSYTGTTTINSGTLNFAADTSQLSGNIVNNGVLKFTQTANSKITGIISGNGRMNQSGSNRLVVSGSNTYAGGTTINTGVVQTENASALGTGAVTINGGALRAIGQLNVSDLTWNAGTIGLAPLAGDVINVAGAFTSGVGGGLFALASQGMMANQAYTLVNFNSSNFNLNQFSVIWNEPGVQFSSSFLLNPGSVQIIITGATAGGAYLDNIRDVPVYANFTTIGTVISGLTGGGFQELQTFVQNLFVPNSSLIVPTPNILTVTGFMNMANSSLTVNGRLNVLGNFTDPNSIINVTGTMSVGGNTIIEGNSSLTVATGGTFSTTGSTSFTNSTANVNGVLSTGTTFTASASTVTVNGSLGVGSTAAFENNSSLTLNSGALMTVGGNTAIAGNTTLTIASGATMNTTGSTSLSDSTALVNGTSSTGSNFNSSSSTVSVNGTVGVGGSASLNNNSRLRVNNGGVMTVGGTTSINSGSQAVINGRLTSPQVNVNSGGLLTGAGLIAGNVLNSGTVAPGNSPGTLTITGGYTQGSTGTLIMEIASQTVFDRLIVGGNANLGGTLQLLTLSFQLAYGQQFQLLQAGSISGQFDSIAVPDPSNYRARFLQNGGTGTVLIAPASYTLVAQTQNQKNVAGALNKFISATSGDKQTVSIALDLQSESAYPAAFDAISPAFYESLTETVIEMTNARTQMLAQRASAVRLGARGFQSIGIEAPLKYDKDGRSVMDAKDGKNILSPADDNNWGVWVQANGIFAHAAGLGGVSSYNSQNGGFLVGGDYRWSENFVTGVYGGYQGTYSKYGNGGVTTINGVDFGVYAGYQNGGFYSDAIIGGGSSSYAVRRPINFSTVDRTATSRPNGGQFTSYLGLGYDWNVGNFTFGPILSGQYTYAGIAPFTENGAGALDLAVGQQNVSSLRSSLGGRVAYTWNVSKTIAIIPEGRLLWQHEFLENSGNIGASLDGGGGSSFGYTTSAPDRDAVFAGAGLSAQFGPNWNAYFYYNADFGRQDYISHSISTGLNFKF